MSFTRRQLLAASLLLPSATISAARRATDPRIIVIGAGFGGATCARLLRRLMPKADVLLIERRAQFFTGPFSNLLIAGLCEPHSIRRDTALIAKAHGVRLMIDDVEDIDPVRLSIRTRRHGRHVADRIVVAPGIALRWDRIEGLDALSSAQMPHAWTGDDQVLQLRARVAAIADGDTVLIGAPPNPYRCPPGPYERASLIAAALQGQGRRGVKILIADAKDDFAKRALFELEWDRLYPQQIEWIPRAGKGEVVGVDTEKNEVWLRDATRPLKVALASIIPAQCAAELAMRADLCDESGWCPIDPARFESKRHLGIHVIGDAALAAPMPKSGFSANSQAKLCALAIAAQLAGLPAPEPQLLNTCYSLLDTDSAISVSGRYGTVAGRLSVLSDGMSPLSGDAALRRRESEQARSWYESITADSFGPR